MAERAPAVDDTGDETRDAARARIAQVCADVAEPEAVYTRLSRVRQRTLARPPGSLGRLDDLVDRIAAIRRDAAPGPLPAVVSVLAGDHGVAARGTSAYSPDVTARVLELILAGQAPVNVLAAQAGARVVAADLGLLTPVGDQRFKVAAGTADLCEHDAMTPEQAGRAILTGVAYAEAWLGDEPLVAVGEIGVGNTTATAALAARLLGDDPDQLVGAGSGIDADAVERKRGLVATAVRRTAQVPDDPFRLLAALGGLEIAGNVGVVLAAARARRVVVLDGYISAVAALVAIRLCPAAQGYLVAGHRSAEPGHRLLLDALGLSPLLSLDLRLGMGAGAALALPVINGALATAASTPRARSVGLAAPEVVRP